LASEFDYILPKSTQLLLGLDPASVKKIQAMIVPVLFSVFKLGKFMVMVTMRMVGGWEDTTGKAWNV
jgi:hypothetical protein